MVKWPNGNKMAVMLTFDMDGETLWTSRNSTSWDSPAVLAHGAYGPREGAPRILDLLDKHGIKSTFFIPGWIIEKYEPICREIHARGHEIAYHGYLHEFSPNSTYAEEAELMEKCEKIIANITGKKPVGQRTPNGVVLPHTPQLLLDRGYKYASSLCPQDSPYFYQIDGKDIPLIQLPTETCYDDSSYYFFTLQEPVRRGIATGSQVYEIWSEEFDGLYEEGKMMNIIMHPQITGRVSRVKTLERLINHMKEKEGVWFARCDEVAEYVHANPDCLKA